MFYDVFEGLCRQKGVSPNKACVEMGLSRSISAKWKSTKTNPSADVLPKIADYFGVPVDYLLGHYPTVDMYEVVSYLCQKNGISISQMCHATGVSESTITSLKHKRLAQLSFADQVSIANYFQISTDVFLEGVLDETLPNQSDSESIVGFHYLQIKIPPAVTDEGKIDEELISLLCQLNQEELKQVDAFVKGILSSHKE